MENALDDVAKRVVDAVARAAGGLPVESVELRANLADLGLSSLQLVDVALCIEEALGLSEFPIQAWLDAQAELGERGFTVESLVGECRRLLDADPRLEVRVNVARAG
jgi:acyl carrier protein